MSNRTAKVGGLFRSRKAVSLMVDRVNWAVCSTNEVMEWFDDGGKDEVLTRELYVFPSLLHLPSFPRETPMRWPGDCVQSSSLANEGS